MRQSEALRQRDFRLEVIRYITSRDIWLALDDTPQEMRMESKGKNPPLVEMVSLPELETFHRQLFYWLLVRCGPCVFPEKLQLRQGVPACLQGDN